MRSYKERSIQLGVNISTQMGFLAFCNICFLLRETVSLHHRVMETCVV